MDKYGHRSSDGGIDPLDVPGASGRLWMCGKHAIGPDVDAARRRADHAQIVVCLVERHELVGRYDGYVSWLDASSSAALWRPTPDLHVGDPEATAELVTTVGGHLGQGRNVLVHCAAGYGRTGTLAAMVLVDHGLTSTVALERIAAARPMAGPEAGSQLELLRWFEDTRGGRP